MIAAHEVIEQIEEEPFGRPMSWVCDFIRSACGMDPFTVLSEMWHAGHILLWTDSGEALPDWECRQVFVAGDKRADILVAATPAGSSHVHGS